MRDIQGRPLHVDPRRELQPTVGRAFRPHTTDSVGRVLSVGGRTVTFAYDHAPKVVYSMQLREFTNYFAEWIGGAA